MAPSQDFFKYWDILVFVEAVIYTLDEINEKIAGLISGNFAKANEYASDLAKGETIILAMARGLNTITSQWQLANTVLEVFDRKQWVYNYAIMVEFVGSSGHSKMWYGMLSFCRRTYSDECLGKARIVDRQNPCPMASGEKYLIETRGKGIISDFEKQFHIVTLLQLNQLELCFE